MFALLVIIFLFSVSPALASKCYGEDPCYACHTCEQCAHCNSGGNPCGVLKQARGYSAIPVKHRSAHPVAKIPQQMEVWGGGLKKGDWYFGADNKLHHVVKKVEVEHSTSSISPTLLKPRGLPSTVSNFRTAPSAIQAEPIPLAPIYSNAAPTVSQAQLNPLENETVIGPPCEWQLSVTPDQSSVAPETVVSFNHWTDMQVPGRAALWNSWGERLLHIIYLELCTRRGKRSENDFQSYVIHVRSDGRIMMQDIGNFGKENIQALKAVVDNLNGRPELAFPTQLRSDTVNIFGMIGFAPERISKDVWGRAQVQPNDYMHKRTW